jgi:hypothetical protein
MHAAGPDARRRLIALLLARGEIGSAAAAGTNQQFQILTAP